MAKAAPTKPTTKAPSAASRFKELIMAGKLTDDQIFEKVKAEFNLDDGKRGYVGWYRNALRKEGAGPPEPKGGVPARKAPPTKAQAEPATAGKKGGKAAAKPAAKGKPTAKKPAPRKPKAPKAEAPPAETPEGGESQES